MVSPRQPNCKTKIKKTDSNCNYFLLAIKVNDTVDGFICTFNDYYMLNNYYSDEIMEIERGKNALIIYNLC